MSVEEDRVVSRLDETLLSSQTVYQGRLLHVKVDQVTLPDGQVTGREYIIHPGAVAIVPWLDTGEVVLVRQFRYPLRQDFFELPAGKIDTGEAALTCGRRELREETGYEAAHWHLLAKIHPCIGYSNEQITFYLAEGLRQRGHCRDADEFLDVFSVPLADAMEWIRDGRITDGKTVTGLLWAEKFIQGAWR